MKSRPSILCVASDSKTQNYATSFIANKHLFISFQFFPIFKRPGLNLPGLQTIFLGFSVILNASQAISLFSLIWSFKRLHKFLFNYVYSCILVVMELVKNVLPIFDSLHFKFQGFCQANQLSIEKKKLNLTMWVCIIICCCM